MNDLSQIICETIPGYKKVTRCCNACTHMYTLDYGEDGIDDYCDKHVNENELTIPVNPYGCCPQFNCFGHLKDCLEEE